MFVSLPPPPPPPPSQSFVPFYFISIAHTSTPTIFLVHAQLLDTWKNGAAHTGAGTLTRRSSCTQTVTSPCHEDQTISSCVLKKKLSHDSINAWYVLTASTSRRSTNDNDGKKAENKESDTHKHTPCDAKKPKIREKKNYFSRAENNETWPKKMQSVHVVFRRVCVTARKSERTGDTCAQHTTRRSSICAVAVFRLCVLTWVFSRNAYSDYDAVCVIDARRVRAAYFHCA